MIEFRIVRFVLLEYVVDRRWKHPGNGDNDLFVATALLERKIAVTDFRESFGPNGTERTLHQQGLNVGSGPANSGGFLLPGALVVLRRKPSPGAKMLRGREHGHIHSDFRDDSNSSKGLNTRHRHNKVEMRKVFLGGGQNQRFQIELAQFQTVHVGTDDAALFGLFFTHLSVHGGKHLFVGCFHAFGSETRNIHNFLSRVVQNSGSNCRGGFTKHTRCL